MFIDEAKVQLKAGNGGAGCVSFRRAKFEPKGGPDGGDGGKGGDVLLVANENKGDLRDYYYKPNWAAGNGRPGSGQRRNGKSGADLRVEVPPGTVACDLETGQPVAEVLEHGESVVLLKGGIGGRGNTTFKSSVNQAPRRADSGMPGEVGDFVLVLKTIADVGLVGFPNAGKSSLIRLLSSARPKTGAYPFTTLNPNVGVIERPGRYDRLIMADIPGLIHGAHENKGLGHRFLRHIERCNLLLFIIDMSGLDGRDPTDDYRDLVRELELYDKTLLQKEQLIAANKMDLDESAENLEAFRKACHLPLLPISCLENTGVDALRDKLFDAVEA